MEDNFVSMHGSVLLSEYPVLAGLARERTTATRLDGRACKALYLDALPSIDLATVPEVELGLMRRLGVC